MDKDEKQFIRFYLNGEACAVSIDLVYKIIHFGNITDVPYTPDFILGITNLRGDILAVMGLKTFLGMPNIKSSITAEKDRSIIITNYLGKLLGLVVDKVLGVISFQHSEIKPTPQTITTELAKYVNGVAGSGDSFTVLIDFESIITSNRFEPFS
ncbi:purine-binding chemotaxis protein CheW [bacterium]|nr:purine-binding chemotaxis protein CheW [bacterium]